MLENDRSDPCGKAFYPASTEVFFYENQMIRNRNLRGVPFLRTLRATIVSALVMRAGVVLDSGLGD